MQLPPRRRIKRLRDSEHLGAYAALMTLGERLRAARETAGLTQQDVATHIGRTKTAVSYWESDNTRPSVPDRTDLAHLLNLPFSSLLPEFDAQAIELATLTDPALKQLVRLWPTLAPRWREVILSVIAMQDAAHTPPDVDGLPIDQLQRKHG